MDEKLKLMEDYLKQDKQTFIKYEDKITVDTFNKLKEFMFNYKKQKVKDCFEQTDVSGLTFIVEYPCCCCGKTRTEQLTKTKLFEMLENKTTQLCYECLEATNREKQKRLDEIKENNKKIAEMKEKEFFDEWLNPDYSLTTDVYKKPYNAKNNVINCLMYIDKYKIKDYVNNQMSYKMYLSTPYWQLVSLLAKRKANYKCQLCGGSNNLNTHHRTYENKGMEINNMGDLIVLCQECHQKFHEVV